MFRAESLIAVLVACSTATSICSAQFISPPIALRHNTRRDGDQQNYASLMLVPPSVYTTGDPMPLGTRVEFRVHICERNEEGKMVHRPLQIVSGFCTFVGAPLNTTQVLLPDSTDPVRLAVTAVVHGSESRPRIVDLSTPGGSRTPLPKLLAIREFSRSAE